MDFLPEDNINHRFTKIGVYRGKIIAGVKNKDSLVKEWTTYEHMDSRLKEEELLINVCGQYGEIIHQAIRRYGYYNYFDKPTSKIILDIISADNDKM